MAPTRSLIVLVASALGIAGSAACYKDPNKALDEAQQTIDLQAALEDIGSRTSELQFAVDSLRGVVAKQDSTIARLANLAGVPYSR